VVEARNEADSLCYNTEKTLLEHKAKVPAEDVETITADIAALKEASSGDGVKAEELKAAIEKLKTSSMKIGEAIYKNADSSGEGDAAPEQKADYEDVPKDKDGDKKK